MRVRHTAARAKSSQTRPGQARERAAKLNVIYGLRKIVAK